MKYLFFVLFFLTYSNQCYNQLDKSIVQPELSIPFITNGINWRMILSEMLQSPLFFDDVPSDSLVLVNIIKNNTNIFIQTTKITSILIELIKSNTKKCNIINMEQLYHAYRELEISSEEILNSYAFSIEIANYLKADYVIYGIAYENTCKLNIELQLILSKTGEILRVIRRAIDQDDNDCIYN